MDVRCSYPGCTGTVQDGYCDMCGMAPPAQPVQPASSGGTYGGAPASAPQGGGAPAAAPQAAATGPATGCG